MILDIFEYLLNQYASKLAITTMKGNPTWARPALALPVLALACGPTRPAQTADGPVARVGQHIAGVSMAFNGWLFARNEPELMNLLDALLYWHLHDGQTFEIAAQRVACKLQGTDPYEPVNDLEFEAHAHTFMVEVLFTS